MKEKEIGCVSMGNIRQNVLEKVVGYCYTGHIEISPEDVEDILDAANMLGLKEVASKCFEFYQNNMSIKNWQESLELAEKYNCIDMKEFTEDFALKNFRYIVNTIDFLNLKYNNLVQLISHNNLNIPGESDVYEAVLRWVKHNSAERSVYLKELLQFIRFPNLTRKFLIDVVTKEELIITDTACRKFLYKALDYHLVPERRNKLTTTKTFSPRSCYPKEIYVFGGENRIGALDTVEKLDLTSNTWVECTKMQLQLKCVAVTVFNGTIYVIGGIDHHGHDLNSLSKYDPVEDKWMTKASMQHCQGSLSACVIDGWVYAIGGSNGNSSLNCVERYDPETDVWSSVESMINSRSHFAAGVLNNTLYAVGGVNGNSATQSCETYDPLTNKWQEMTHLNKARMDHGVTVNGGKLFAIGGVSHNEILDCIEKYNRGLQMWLIIKHTLDPRTAASICLIQSEEKRRRRLLIIGGIDESYCYHSSVKEINLTAVDYCVTNGKSMLEPRAYGGVIAL